MTKVIFIAYNDIYTEGLKKNIYDSGKGEVLAVYEDTKSFFLDYDKGMAKVIFVDILAINESLSQIAKKIKTIDPEVLVIGTSLTYNPNITDIFLSQEGDGFLIKIDDNQYVINQMMENPVQGKKFLSPKIARKKKNSTPTVLVIDDFENTRFIVTFTLEKENFRVLKASNGLEGLKLLEQNEVDLIITDLNMPQMDGFEFIKEVRDNPKYRNIPIIVLTTEFNQEKKQEARQLKITGWIQKPFEVKTFINTVKMALE